MTTKDMWTINFEELWPSDEDPMTADRAPRLVPRGWRPAAPRPEVGEPERVVLRLTIPRTLPRLYPRRRAG